MTNVKMLKYSNVKMEKNGFTLIELMMAIFMMVVGVLGTMNLIQGVLFLSSVSYSRLTAAYLAQEGIEIIRNTRDTNWLEARAGSNLWYEGLTVCGISGFIVDYNHSYGPDPTDPIFPCYADQYLNIDSNGFYGYSPGIKTKFKRRITVAEGETIDIRVVSAEVSWTDKGVPYSFVVQERLYDWR